MALLIRQLDSIEDINVFLRGGIQGRVKLGKDLFDLNGKTLIFTGPAVTVTFATTPAAAQVPLSVSAMLGQLNTQLTGNYVARIVRGRLVVVDSTGALATVLANTGTANAALGFVTDVATTGVVYAPASGAAPRLISIDPLATSAAYLITTDE